MQSFILQVDESLVRLSLLPGMLIQICILKGDLENHIEARETDHLSRYKVK